MRVVTFIGYKAGKQIVVRGQVLLQAYKEPLRKATPWQNFKSNISRFFAKPKKAQQLIIVFDNQEQRVRTNKKGFFQATFSSNAKGWQKATIINPKTKKTVNESILCDFTGYGLISDVDDTIMTSHATNFWKKIYLILFKNSFTRKEIRGMSAFLRCSKAQVFYVSNSSWELYDFIKEFCALNHFPKGPFLLSNRKLIGFASVSNNKLFRIQQLLNGYTQQFFLLGDAGQQDPFTYKKIAQLYPKRIKAIFIRANNKQSARKARKILRNAPVPFFVEEDSNRFSEHLQKLL